MRFVRTLAVIIAALGGSGCTTTGVVPPPSIDSIVYGDTTGSVRPGPVIAVPSVVPVAPAVAVVEEKEPPYTLDSGDKLRVMVYGQDGLTNSYSVDAAGRITMPLIGAVPARGRTTADLSKAVAARLRDGFLREPHVAVEIEAYRPFFILGEVTYPGQYPFVAHMTVETAVAIAGGFTPRAYRCCVHITRQTPQGPVRLEGPMMTALRPGDTVMISERWF